MSAEQDQANAVKAKQLISLSRIFGWTGLAMLLLGAPATLILARSTAGAGAVAGIGMIGAVTGAIIGQVGRGMQGRVI